MALSADKIWPKLGGLLMRTALGFAMLIAFACNRPEETSNETIANGRVLSANTGKSGDPASYTVLIAT